MEDWILDDLLECSVCLERLDTSSKVLPCQHTFCKKCLEEISRTHNELRCPECRILVEANIDDLPPNVLLMRILEGIRNAAPDHVNSSGARTTPLSGASSTKTADTPKARAPRIPHADKPSNRASPSQPCAKAIYDYISNEPGDLSFKKGDLIYLRKKVDLNWFKGDINGRVGVFPANYVQIIEPLPSQVPQCKALYDFKMANDEEEGCLAFTKGEVITVIRRVDENWAEGKLNNKIGIFPIAFVELNSVAQALVKLSVEAQPGPSRVVPPTPASKEDKFPISSSAYQLAFPVPAMFPSTVAPSLPTSDSSSASLTSPSSTSNSTTPTTSSTSSHNSPSSPSRAIPLSPPVVGPPKRHSFGSSPSNGSKSSTKRHSAEILGNNDTTSNEPLSLPASVDVPLPQPPAVLERSGSQRVKRSSEVPPIPGPQLQHVSLQLPALYVALYPYKPGNSDELELKRGAIYTVTERCQDGWFKGQHFRSQKTGVFPGNYVAPAKSLPALQAQVRGLCRPKPSASHNTSSRNGTPPLEPRNAISYLKPQTNPAQKDSRALMLPGPPPSASLSPEQSSTTVVPPPNVSIPSASVKTAEKGKERKEKSGGLMRRLTSIKKSKSPPPTPYSMDNPVFEDLSVTVSPPVHVRSGSCPNQLIFSTNADSRFFSPTSSHRSKMKERPSISRMAPRAPPDSRNIQHRKSSSVDTPGSESLDLLLGAGSRPTFSEEQKGLSSASATSLPGASKPLQPKPGSHGSEAFPSDPTQRSLTYEELLSQVSARLQGRSTTNETAPKSSKRSSSSGGQSSESAHVQDSKPQPKGLPLPRERFRCIVPYPPNSEYELELQLGDVIYVHKKREDGWYKGTQQRTGRTGLFPASFVQSF